MCQYYSLKENKIIHMNYVDKNTFYLRFFLLKALGLNTLLNWLPILMMIQVLEDMTLQIFTIQ